MGDSKTNSADDWIQEALYEYEQIANLCNQQSHLGQASLSSAPSPSLPASHDGTYQSIGFDPKTLEAAIKHDELIDHLSTYSEAIESVRQTHKRLKSKLVLISKEEDNESFNNSEQPEQIKSRRTTSAIKEAFLNHLQLSERVTRTIMKSSKTDCGILYENGMIRTASANDHEVNVVALAALRASVSQLKSTFGTSSKS